MSYISNVHITDFPLKIMMVFDVDCKILEID